MRPYIGQPIWLRLLLLMTTVTAVKETAEELKVPQAVKDILMKLRREVAKRENGNIALDDSGPSEPISGLFEGDILLTEEQAQAILDDELKSGGRSKRKVAKHIKFWSQNINYSLQRMKNPRTREVIKEGIKQWQDNTCIKFRETNGRTGDFMDFFVGSGPRYEGCWTRLGIYVPNQPGMIRNGISIGKNCEHVGIVAHEIGHSLGMWHEQSRPDRDKYVTYNRRWQNKYGEGQFERRSYDSSMNLGVPYDLGSVMHYGPSDFSIDPFNPERRTLVANDKLYSNTMGQRDGLSFTDIRAINMIYCKDTCRGRKNDCKNDGYLDPKDCSRCKCPFGLAGKCDKVAPSPRGCGGTQTATSSWSTVSSNTVTRDRDCNWLIKSDNGGKVEVKIEKLDYPCGITCTSFLEIKAKQDFQPTGARLCCDREQSRTTLTSETDTVVLIHRMSSQGGFSLKYRSVGGGGPRKTTRRPIRTTRQPVRTTRRPVRTTPRPNPGPGNKGWSEWSSCSADCGGCAERKRQRPCHYHDCGIEYEYESEGCRKEPCRPTQDEIYRCQNWDDYGVYVFWSCPSPNGLEMNSDGTCCYDHYNDGSKCVKDPESETYSFNV